MKNTKIATIGLGVVFGAPTLLGWATLSVLLGSADQLLADGPGESHDIARASPAGARATIPSAMFDLYRSAAATCPGLSWTVLAAIGTVESANGASNSPGVHSGANAAGAEGPMQFEPGTFAEYARPVPQGGADPPSPYDPADAVYTAARMLCAAGAGYPASLASAVFAYNHSGAYVRSVLSLSADLQAAAAAPDGGPGATAAGFALAQIGTPYRWGGETARSGFDCSGLAQAAWRAGGVSIPRVAQAQYDAGPHLPAQSALQAGDLVFFGSGPTAVTHVGLVVDAAGQMVDAPHSGSVVRVERFPTTPGGNWGNLTYIGATRP